jgi:hypothetical protein
LLTEFDRGDPERLLVEIRQPPVELYATAIESVAGRAEPNPAVRIEVLSKEGPNVSVEAGQALAANCC